MGPNEETLEEAALRVLNTADPFKKARLGDSVASRWVHGAITEPYDPSRELLVPDRPARLSNVKLVAPSLMPKLGKAGSLQSRIAIVHSLAHTESWAIDLSWVFSSFHWLLFYFRVFLPEIQNCTDSIYICGNIICPLPLNNIKLKICAYYNIVYGCVATLNI